MISIKSIKKHLPLKKATNTATNTMLSLYEIGIKYNCDKITQHGYHRFYTQYLNKWRNKPIKMLEIGIDKERSLKMWQEYFAKGTIFGVDKKLEGVKNVFTGDQSDTNFLQAVHTKAGPFDCIIDDGSHVPEHQVSTFNYLFKHSLKNGGIYIVEDIETSYWTNGDCYNYQINKGYLHKESAIEIFKKVIDVINKEFLDETAINLNCEIPLSVSRLIAQISFQQNCIIITKKNDKDKKYDNRKYRYKHKI